MDSATIKRKPESLAGYTDHPIQQLMSRTGSFPLHVGLNLIEQHSLENEIVLDPFCGKGTTLLAARLLNREVYGLDIAPEAMVCSRAKLADVTLNSITEYVTLMITYVEDITSVPPEVSIFFHPSTLRQILAIKRTLIKDCDSSNICTRFNAQFVLGVLLGILHGHASYSLSVPCAHAYSMSPRYVQRFASEHGLTAPEVDVKSCILAKAARCLRRGVPSPVSGRVECGSIMRLNEIFPDLLGKVDLILTSPPYLNAQTYPKDNWLRLWLLGFDHRAIRASYIQTASISRYKEAMATVFQQVGIMLRPGGKLICIAGDVRSRQSKEKAARPMVETGHILADVCTYCNAGLVVTSFEEQQVQSHSRYYHALSKSNGHLSGPYTERLFIAQKA